MEQEQPIKLDDQDDQLFTDMALRIELTKLWTELASLVVPGYALPQGQPMGKHGQWRCYPLARQGGEQPISRGAAHALQHVTSRKAGEYTVADVCATQWAVFALLEGRQTVMVEA